MKPDVIICWPGDVYYPWFVWRMNQDRRLFDRVIVVITRGVTDRDYSNAIKNNIRDVSVIDRFPDNGRDWRDAAIREGLRFSFANHLLFLEQDFLYEDGFMEKLLEYGEDHPVIGMREGNRLHPACLLVTRPLLGDTSRDFSHTPDIGDHFHKLTQELDELVEVTDLTQLVLPKHCHLAGLTQNYRLDSNWYHPSEFFTYNYFSGCLPDKYSMPKSWYELCMSINGKGEGVDINQQVKDLLT